ETAQQVKGLHARLKALLSVEGDKAADFIWSITKPVLLYAAERVGEIADDIVAMDQAMRWGFGWELGPFEIWDAIGLKKTVKRMQAEGDTVPDWIIILLENGNQSFYKTEENQVFYFH